MAKWITLAIVAALLFSVGLYAGHRVPFSVAIAKGPTSQTILSSAVVIQDLADNATAKPSTKSSDIPYSLVSRGEPVADVEFRTAEFDDLRAADVNTVGVSDIAVSDAERAAIRRLILAHFPNTESDLAEIWVETCAGMDLDEVNFVLEQKKQTSFEPGTGLAISPGSSPASTSAIASPTTKSEPAFDSDIDLVTSNLRSAYSIGYRRMVVLPEAVDSLASSTDPDRRDVPSTRFRSFESGPLLQSPITTHVALSRETSVMFCLEGNRVTRRGDFQILTDRRLGIFNSRGEFAALESTPLPEDAKGVHILQNGTVRFTNAADEVLDAGRITVCRITNLADLQSSDGVLFLASDARQLEVLEHPDSVLQLNCLEQSNVNRADENLLREHLKSLSNSSL